MLEILLHSPMKCLAEKNSKFKKRFRIGNKKPNDLPSVATYGQNTIIISILFILKLKSLWRTWLADTLFVGHFPQLQGKIYSFSTNSQRMCRLLTMIYATRALFCSTIVNNIINLDLFKKNAIWGSTSLPYSTAHTI